MMANDKSEERQIRPEDLDAERERLRITLASIGDAVISTDAEGRVVFLNSVAETLTGWTQAVAEGQPLTEVFQIVNEYTREPAENPAFQALREGVIVGLANHTVLIARDGTERPIDDSAAPIRDEAGRVAGVGLVLPGRPTVLVARGGTERPIDGSAAPGRAEAGRVAGVVLVFRDVTERRRAEVA